MTPVDLAIFREARELLADVGTQLDAAADRLARQLPALSALQAELSERGGDGAFLSDDELTLLRMAADYVLLVSRRAQLSAMLADVPSPNLN